MLDFNELFQTYVYTSLDCVVNFSYQFEMLVIFFRESLKCTSLNFGLPKCILMAPTLGASFSFIYCPFSQKIVRLDFILKSSYYGKIQVKNVSLKKLYEYVFMLILNYFIVLKFFHLSRFRNQISPLMCC